MVSTVTAGKTHVVDRGVIVEASRQLDLDL